MQTPVILAQYFEKYRATATAISYAGGTIGSFIFPPILEYILAEYGLNGSFLIIGGIMLNALPFALLMRPATPEDKVVDRLIQGVHNFTSSRREKILAMYQLKKHSLTLSSRRDHRNEMHMIMVRHKCNCEHFVIENEAKEDEKDWSDEYNYVTKALIRSTALLEKSFETLYEMRKFMTEYECVCVLRQREESMDDFSDKACQTEETLSNFKRNWQLIYSVISNPLYLILSTTHVSFQWA